MCNSKKILSRPLGSCYLGSKFHLIHICFSLFWDNKMSFYQEVPKFHFNQSIFIKQTRPASESPDCVFYFIYFSLRFLSDSKMHTKVALNDNLVPSYLNFSEPWLNSCCGHKGITIGRYSKATESQFH